MIELAVAAAVLGPALGGAVAWFAPARWTGWIAGAAYALAAAGVGVLVLEAFGAAPIAAGGGLIRMDELSAYIMAIVLLVGGLAVAASPRSLAAEPAHGEPRAADRGRYYALLLWFLASLLAVPVFDSLGLVWVALEGATAVSALLVGFHRTPAALEATWKYLIIGSLGIGFALLGTVLLYASSVGALGETSDALNWSVLIGNAGQLDPSLVRLGFVFALVGYGTKVGLVPFHTWLPDAHSQAPSPVSALLSGATLGVGLYALIRVHLVTSAAVGPDFSSTLLVVFGLLSIAVSLPFLIAQGDLKRLLAYSSIEHMGLLTLAVGFGGRLALLGATLQLLAHALAKAAAFIAAGDLVQHHGTRRLGRLGGGLASAPSAGWPLLAAVLLLGGLPPSATFVAELAIIAGGVQQGWLLAAAGAAAMLGVAFAAMAFHVLRVAWGRPRRAVPATPRPARAVLVGTPVLVVALLGLWIPQPLDHALEAVATVLGGGGG